MSRATSDVAGQKPSTAVVAKQEVCEGCSRSELLPPLAQIRAVHGAAVRPMSHLGVDRSRDGSGDEQEVICDEREVYDVSVSSVSGRGGNARHHRVNDNNENYFVASSCDVERKEVGSSSRQNGHDTSRESLKEASGADIFWMAADTILPYWMLSQMR